MQYLCLIYHDQEPFRHMSAAELETLDRDSSASDEEMIRRGQLVLAHPLKLPATAKQVRVRAKKKHIMDGPFTETKEQMIGFLLINAGSMDEAVDIAAAIPLARTGVIEVRGISFIGDPELQQSS
jgi:hypothetical protein